MLLKPSERHKKGVCDSRQTLPSEGYIIVVFSKRLQNYEYFRRYDDNRLRFSLLVTPKSGGRFCAHTRIKACDIAGGEAISHPYDAPL